MFIHLIYVHGTCYVCKLALICGFIASYVIVTMEKSTALLLTRRVGNEKMKIDNDKVETNRY